MAQNQVGIFAGTFDPIHQGHIAFAQEAMRICGLDSVVFLPESLPRDKQNVTELRHRVALIKLTTKHKTQLEILQLKAESFTVAETLPELRARFPNAQLTFLMGSDVAKSLAHWEGVGILLANAGLAIGLRASDNEQELQAALERLGHEHGLAVRYAMVSTSASHVTSSKIRNDPHQLSQLDPAVRQYIEQHRLYLSIKI